MESNELFELLNDKNKKISSYDPILTYLSKRMSEGDINGLYALTIALIDRVEKENAFTTSDIIYLYFFAMEILEKENVSWRIKPLLKKIDEEYIPLLENNLNKEDEYSLKEIAEIYFKIAKHYELINLARYSIKYFAKAKDIYLLMNAISEASFCYEEELYMVHRLPKNEQVFPSLKEVKEKYRIYSKGIIKAISGRGKLKRDPIEQDEKYLKVIDGIEEKIVLKLGVYSSIDSPDFNLKDYYLIKKELLKDEGISWSSPLDLNPNAIRK